MTRALASSDSSGRMKLSLSVWFTTTRPASIENGSSVAQYFPRRNSSTYTGTDAPLSSTTTRDATGATADPSLRPDLASNTWSSTSESASRFSVTWKVSTWDSLAATITAPEWGS